MDRAPLRVIMDDNYPPNVMRDANGAVEGLLINEWRLWEKKRVSRPALLSPLAGKKITFFLREARAEVPFPSRSTTAIHAINVLHVALPRRFNQRTIEKPTRNCVLRCTL